MWVTCFIISSYLVFANSQESSLKLAHVIIRHGDRTTDPKSFYPTDPHKNQSYYPYGIGELTNKGKKRSYEVGKYLRKRYDNFLGSYTPDLVEGTSSSLNRTKVTLELVLAGLFPPEGDQIWQEGLNWQPIPFNFLPRDQDLLFFSSLCPNFEKASQKLAASPKYVKEFLDFKPVFEYLTLKTGWTINDYSKMLFLYSGLQTDQEFGLTLPDWTNLVYPELLHEMLMRYYTFATYTDFMKSLTSGYLLEKILLDTVRKVDGSLSPRNRKLFLYSGHDFTLSFMLKGLGIPVDKTSPYSAFIIFELHEIDKVYGFKIFYQDYNEEEPQLLTIPGCKEFCSLGRFFAIVKRHLPMDNSCGN